MLTVKLPGRENLQLEHLVLDYNGTLAVDGRLAEGVAERLRALSAHLTLHVITADTFGSAAAETGGLPVTLQVIAGGDHTAAKEALVQRLGAGATAAVGNGANDVRMLKTAVLGICMLGREGCATPTLLASDVVVSSPADALDLLLKPGRLTATLRV